MIITIDTLNSTLKVTPQAENELAGVETIRLEGEISADALAVFRISTQQHITHEIEP